VGECGSLRNSEFADWIKLTENSDELWFFCGCLMNIPKTEKFFDFVSNYLLFMRGCTVQWITTDVNVAEIGQ
jgi:hypothetical protein